mmetsp:Transcript_28633/g.96403  ORF Transcript_28633/g.96403 Transcript_28633/m.96403 type:complete len:475 (-) Transcript_28633:98-1522(-)
MISALGRPQSGRQPVAVDADREHSQPSAVAVPLDVVHLGSVARDSEEDAAEVSEVSVRVEPNQVGPQHAEEEVLAFGQRGEDFKRREGDVQEPGDAQSAVAAEFFKGFLPDEFWDQEKVKIVDPDHVSVVRLVDHFLRVPFVGSDVGAEPPLRVEPRKGRHPVQQWPERGVAIPRIERVRLRGRQEHGDQTVPLLQQPRVPRLLPAGENVAAGPPDPPHIHAPQRSSHAAHGRHQTARLQREQLARRLALLGPRRDRSRRGEVLGLCPGSLDGAEPCSRLEAEASQTVVECSGLDGPIRANVLRLALAHVAGHKGPRRLGAEEAARLAQLGPRRQSALQLGHAHEALRVAPDGPVGLRGQRQHIVAASELNAEARDAVAELGEGHGQRRGKRNRRRLRSVDQIALELAPQPLEQDDALHGAALGLERGLVGVIVDVERDREPDRGDDEHRVAAPETRDANPRLDENAAPRWGPL